MERQNSLYPHLKFWPVGPLVVVVSLSRRISGGFDTHTGRQFLVRAESKGLSPVKWEEPSSSLATIAKSKDLMMVKCKGSTPKTS